MVCRVVILRRLPGGDHRIVGIGDHDIVKIHRTSLVSDVLHEVGGTRGQLRNIEDGIIDRHTVLRHRTIRGRVGRSLRNGDDDQASAGHARDRYGVSVSRTAHAGGKGTRVGAGREIDIPRLKSGDRLTEDDRELNG